MHPVQAHMLVNHLPIIGTAIGLMLVVVGMMRRNDALKRAGLIIYTVMGLAVIPATITGDEAEHAVEHVVGVSEPVLEAHEEGGERLRNIMVGTAIISGLLLIPVIGEQKSGSFLLGMWLVAASIACVMAINVGHQGGQIRRPELRGEQPMQQPTHSNP
ncbi:MAG: hypothetical protein MUC47_09935 [Candidatus Kapabacteria bacterium]|nr:hypothetical protein [Candidatus Kapabacteria bacterium]